VDSSCTDDGTAAQIAAPSACFNAAPNGSAPPVLPARIRPGNAENRGNGRF